MSLPNININKLNPKLSIILPNYNYAHYLPKRIESILNQSYSNFELLILDDASTDNSIKVIEEYKRQDTRIKTYYNKENSGSPFIQWDKGIQLSNGELIWIAEADDYCENNFLETLINNFEKSNKVVIAFSDSYILQDKIIGKWSEVNNIKIASELIAGNDLINKYLIHQNAIPNASAVLFKKSKYFEVGGIDNSIANCADWLLWIKMVTNEKLVYVEKPLNYFRRHHGSVIHKSGNNRNSTMFHEFYSMSMRQRLSNWLQSYPQFDSLKSINNSYIAKDLINQSKWASRHKKYLNKYKSVFKAFYRSGGNPSYLAHLFT